MKMDSKKKKQTLMIAFLFASAAVSYLHAISAVHIVVVFLVDLNLFVYYLLLQSNSTEKLLNGGLPLCQKVLGILFRVAILIALILLLHSDTYGMLSGFVFQFVLTLLFVGAYKLARRFEATIKVRKTSKADFENSIQQVAEAVEEGGAPRPDANLSLLAKVDFPKSDLEMPLLSNDSVIMLPDRMCIEGTLDEYSIVDKKTQERLYDCSRENNGRVKCCLKMKFHADGPNWKIRGRNTRTLLCQDDDCDGNIETRFKKREQQSHTLNIRRGLVNGATGKAYWVEESGFESSPASSSALTNEIVVAAQFGKDDEGICATLLEDSADWLNADGLRGRLVPTKTDIRTLTEFELQRLEIQTCCSDPDSDSYDELEGLTLQIV